MRTALQQQTPDPLIKINRKMDKKERRRRLESVGEKGEFLQLPFFVYCVFVSMETGNHSADQKECVFVTFRFARSSLSFS